MKNYSRPNMEVISFDIEDIITVSGQIVNAADLTGEDYNMYKVYQQNSGAQNTNISVFTW